MRILEIALIVANALALLCCFNRQPKGVWLGLRVMGINLGILFFHGIWEGLRYQMTFSYVFVGLFTVYTLSKATGRFAKRRPPTPLKIIAIGLALIGLGATALLATALPVFILPSPTGSYAVGVQYFHLTDAKRPEPFLASSTKKRELLVKVYYPATDDPTKPFAPYFHGSEKLIEAFVRFYNMPGFAFAHLKLVKTNAKEALPVSETQASYPVVLFSHGAGTSIEVQTAQCEDLASHGYIVAAIDHTYVSAATAFDDRMVAHHEATTDFQTAEPAEIITQIMADDAKFVMERLGEMNVGEIASPLQGKVNLEQIGAIGHSLGGAVAYHLAINDPRVKAAIDLDGTVYVVPETGRKVAPFLMLANDQYHAQAIQNGEILMPPFDEASPEEQEMLLMMYGSEAAYQAAYHKAQQNMIGLTGVLKASGNFYTITGSDHMKFSDIGLFIGIPQLRELLNIRGEADPARCLEITQAVTVAFFDQHLQGESSVSLEDLAGKYPALKKVDVR